MLGDVVADDLLERCEHVGLGVTNSPGELVDFGDDHERGRLVERPDGVVADGLWPLASSRTDDGHDVETFLT